MVDINSLLVRASESSKIMTDPRGGSSVTEKQLETIQDLEGRLKRTDKQDEELIRLIKKRDQPPEMSETAKNLLIQMYRQAKYSRRPMIMSKYISKGIREEAAAITLLSLVKNRPFIKNTERLSNRFITGEPDLIPAGQSSKKCEEGYDTKCAWSLETFPTKLDKISDEYYSQNQCYATLCNAERWVTAHCLVNAPGDMIMNAIKGMWYALGMPREDGDMFMQKKIEIEKNMIFDLEEFLKFNPGYDMTIKEADWKWDIPKKERIVEFVTYRNGEYMGEMYDRIVRGRQWLADNINSI